MMADPEYPNKVASGRLHEVRPCTRCGTCLEEGRERHRRCRINPFLGEKKYTVDKAEKKKKVLVVGGGPAGMEAALISAERGHDVTLFDRAARLGGLMPLAGIVKGFEIEELQNITNYFQAQFKKLGVTVRLKEAVNADTIEKMNPDVVFLAEGGIVYAPDIPGIENRNVITAPGLHKKLKLAARFISPETIRKLTKLYMPVGKRAVIIGSGVYGLETAEFLIKRGRDVTIVDTAPEPGIGMLEYRMGLMMPWLEKKGVPVLTNLKAIDITPKGVVVTTAEGEKKTIEADSVLPVAQPKANMDLYESLKGKVPEVYAVGDCSDPSMIVDAIRTAWNAAKEI
jgi:2,4-dienoyl-CoA reductase (NADPH2)